MKSALSPERRRVVVLGALVAIFAGLTPVVLDALRGGARDRNPTAFVLGLAVGVTVALAIGLFVKQRRGRGAGDPS